MESIKVTLEIPLTHRIGDEVEAHFYDKFNGEYQSRMLLGKVTDIVVKFSYMEGEAKISYIFAAECLGKTYTTSL